MKPLARPARWFQAGLAVAQIALIAPASHAATAGVASAPSSCSRAAAIPPGFGPGSVATPNVAGMKPIPAGRFRIGSESGYAEERGGGEVDVPAFLIDAHEVTNAQFTAFVRATSYVTTAERAGGSAVFVAPRPGSRYAPYSWWHWTKGADWQHPQGPASSIKGLGQHPVVHVTVADAQAYAAWLGRSLPTEAQWEYAARGGLSAQQARVMDQIDGNTPEFQAHLLASANTWQGPFPERNSRQDGWRGTAPVGCFAPNGYGLVDMVGNVWELTQDAWRPSHASRANGQLDQIGVSSAELANPDLVRVADRPSSRSSSSEAEATPRVIKGGSYLCAPDFCVRYRPASRQPQDAGFGTSHIGFRTVVNSR
jgi:formylglycine-generating enzyme required for sulfatase activity